MDFIQTDLTDEALVTAIRANMTGFLRHLGKSFPEGWLNNGMFSRWRVPVAHPWFNGVLSARLPTENDPILIEEMIEYFRSQNVSVCTWWMEPHIRCSDWEPVLSPFGFRFSNDTPGMAVDLHELNQPFQTVDGLEVREVADEESLHTWVHVFISGYGMPAEWTPSVYDLEKRVGWEFPVRNFLAYWNGNPVATASLFFSAGVAGIYNVATLPTARGRGIGASATLHALHTAREMRYNIGVLQSSEMGFNIYRRIGFRHLCQIEYFYLHLK